MDGPEERRDGEARSLRSRVASFLERLVTSQADPAVTGDPPAPGSEPPAAG